MYMAETHRSVIATLADSHNNLIKVLDTAGPVTGPSYCTEWTIAQVLSHLGSGAEIGLLNVNAALAGDGPPERDRYFEIWDVWNAKSSDAQASDAVVADAQYVTTLTDLDDSALASLRVPMMGRELDASAFAAMRLFEHAVHVWDVAVMTDADATVLPDAVDILIDRVADRIGRSAKGQKPATTPARLAFITTSPSRQFSLSIEPESVSIDTEEASDGTVTLPAEAFLRLIAGRLDPQHTPESVEVAGAVSLDELRALFDQT
jgi:uncharacterized protein (TIGR03083 family)